MHNRLLNVRLYVTDSINKHSTIILNPLASHYIRKVMRAKQFDQVKVFNGKDGEWIGEICEII